MFNKKKLLIPVLILVVALLGACSNTSDITETETSKLTVEVLDKYDQSIQASVELIDPSDDSVLDTKEGEVVSFEGLKKGEYKLVGKRKNSSLKEETSVVVGKEEESADLKFNDFAGSKAVQEYIFEADKEAEKITIENLGKGEKAIIGVANYEFNANESSKTSLDIKLERSDISKNSNMGKIVPKTDVDNPEYEYQKAPRVDEKNKMIEDPQYWAEGFELAASSQTSASDYPSIPEFGPKEYDIGDKETFYTDYTESGELTATLKGKGEHSYIFVQEGIDYISQETIDKYVKQFDENIYPTTTDFYSSKFDIDQNGKLTILLEEMGGVQEGSIIMGYFHPKDFFTQQQLESLGWGNKSNKADMVYLNAQALQEGWKPEAHLGTIAHEFQHELWWYRTMENGYVWKSADEGWRDSTWINEGMSTFAEQINGYTELTDSRVYTYFDEYNGVETSEASLLYWNQNLADYGISNLFTNYIVEQYGEEILHKIYEDDINPRKTIENYTKKSFDKLFMDWMIANKLHSLELAPEYSYDYSLEGDPEHDVLTSNYSASPEMRNSAVQYYVVEGDGSDVTLTFDGSLSEKEYGVFTYRY